MSEHTPPTVHPVENFAKHIKAWHTKLPARPDHTHANASNVRFFNDSSKYLFFNNGLHPKISLPEDSHLARTTNILTQWAFSDNPNNDMSVQRLINKLTQEYAHAKSDLEQEKKLVMHLRDELQRAYRHPDETSPHFPQLMRCLAYIEEKNLKYQVKTQRKTIKDYWDSTGDTSVDDASIVKLITATRSILERRDAELAPKEAAHAHTTLQKDSLFAQHFLEALNAIQKSPENAKRHVMKLQEQALGDIEKHQHKTKKADHYKKVIADLKSYILFPSDTQLEFITESLERTLLPKHIRSPKPSKHNDFSGEPPKGVWVASVLHGRDNNIER